MKKILIRFFYELPSGVTMGTAIAFWFGLAILIDFFTPIPIGANSFFSTYPYFLRLGLASICLILPLISLWKHQLAIIAVYIICTAQITDAWIHNNNATRIVYWFIIAAFATWGVYQKTSFIEIPDSERDKEWKRVNPHL